MTVEIDTLLLYSSDVLDLYREQDPAEMLRRFNTLSLDSVIAVLASNDCPQMLVDHMMDRYAGHTSRTEVASWRTLTLAAVASRSSNTEEHWDALYRTRSLHVLLALAGNEATPHHLLAKFERYYTNLKIMLELVGNQSVSFASVLAILQRVVPASGTWVDVRHTVLSIIDTAITLRVQTAEERGALLHVLYPPGRRYDWDYGYRLVTDRLLSRQNQHPDATAKIAAVLLTGVTESTRRSWSTGARKTVMSALSHPSLPEDAQREHYWALRSLSDSLPWSDMLASVLQNPNCVPDILYDACSHPNFIIRTVATNNPDCPDEGKVTEALLRPQPGDD